MKQKKTVSTYNRITADPRRKANIEKEYQDLLISERILAAIEKDDLSVAWHTKEAGLSPTIMQELD